MPTDYGRPGRRFKRSLPYTFAEGLLSFTWKAENNPKLAKNKAEAASRGRKEMHWKELKASHMKAVPEYKKKHKRDPVFVLETDWMSDELSSLETDDEEKKTVHRRRLDQAARLCSDQQDHPVWETIRPGFQSTELSDIKDELDGLKAASKNKWYEEHVDGNEELESEMQMYEHYIAILKGYIAPYS
ncbi:hypothetical protein DFH09DRAFT_1085814 [Mycena vulgaris]|nr:hypothetical protein DFH09DRAFT_1085814 [Mycena vulgaris]